MAYFYIIQNEVPYKELGPDWFAKRRPEAQARKLVHQLERLGYSVTLSDSAKA